MSDATAKICGAIYFGTGKICRERPFEDQRRCNEHHDSTCWCCDRSDDLNGSHPAFHTGFCAECQDAGCPGKDEGSPCIAVHAIGAELDLSREPGR